MQIYSLSMPKTIHAWWRITYYKRYPCWLTEHGRSRRVNFWKNPLDQGAHYRAEGVQTHLRWQVRNQEWWNSRSGYPWFQAGLLRQAGQYHSGQKTLLATYATEMVIRNQNSTKPGRRKEQRSSNCTEENSNHTKETQHGSFQIPPTIRVRQENGKELNTWIQ